VKPQIVTKGIVLSRRDYQEADRILSVLTPDNGKVSLIAKGVRKPKSKLAGGIELFSVSQLTYLPSHNDLKTSYPAVWCSTTAILLKTLNVPCSVMNS
jgi:DNA repair protein RecO